MDDRRRALRCAGNRSRTAASRRRVRAAGAGLMRGFDAEQIRRYYDRHTSAFVALGQRGSDGAMHRAVWGPGTATHRQAFRYVEDQIAMLLQGLPPSFESVERCRSRLRHRCELVLSGRAPARPWHRDHAEPDSGALRRTADPQVWIRGSHPLHRGRLLRSTDRHRPSRSRICDRILRARPGSRSLLRTMSRPHSTGRVAPDLRRLPAIVQ